MNLDPSLSVVPHLEASQELQYIIQISIHGGVELQLMELQAGDKSVSRLLVIFTQNIVSKCSRGLIKSISNVCSQLVMLVCLGLKVAENEGLKSTLRLNELNLANHCVHILYSELNSPMIYMSITRLRQLASSSIQLAYKYAVYSTRSLWEVIECPLYVFTSTRILIV